MKHTWKVALAVAVLAGSASVAKADLTLDGQTGLFINPTAQVAREGQGEVQADYQRVSDDGTSFKTYGIGGAAGVADKLELSANYNRLSAYGENANDWRIGGKYQLLSQREKGFDLAVGGNYERASGTLTDDYFGDDLTHWNAYLAATKAFSQGGDRAAVKGTVGVRWDRFSADGESDSKTSVYAGADVPLTSTGELSLIGEVGSKIFDYAGTPYAIGLRYHPRESSFTVGAGYGKSNYLSQLDDKSGFFVQASYKFGK